MKDEWRLGNYQDTSSGCMYVCMYVCMMWYNLSTLPGKLGGAVVNIVNI